MSFNPFKRTPRRGKPEKRIQTEIAVWLRQQGGYLAVTDAGLLHGISTGMPKGWPDLTGCLPCGRFLAVECKAPKGRQSDAQISVQHEIEKRGGLYILAHSLDELIEELRKEQKLGNPLGFILV